MGNRMKRIRKYIIFGIIFAFIINATYACSEKADVVETQVKTSEKESDEKVTKEKNKRIEQTRDEDIPEDLFPGSGVNEAMDGGTTSSAIAGSDTNSNGMGHERQEANESGGSDGGTLQGGQANTEKSAIRVSLNVESSQAESYGYFVNYSASLELKKGTTVYEALKNSGIDSSGSGYIESIGGLPEKVVNAMSGWKYYVNGKESGVGAQEYVLQDGDSVQWSYVLKP